jgi:hypothetical protein
MRLGEGEFHVQRSARIGWALEKDPLAECLGAVFEAGAPLVR